MTSLIPLLIAAGILLTSNGIQSTLIAIRANLEGMSPTVIGAMGTSYFLGYMLGTIAATRLISMVGHIRVFAALAAIAASSVLLLVLFVNPYAWITVRTLLGFCSSGLFTVIESWLNVSADNTNRGRAFSIYGLVDIGAVTGSQFLLPSLGAESFVPFAVMSMLLALALVPIALSPTAQPRHRNTLRLHVWDAWKISPLAFAACLTIGLTNSAFRTVGPLYAQHLGLNYTQIAIFMGAGIGGGAVLQIPFGWLSDRLDRRTVLIIATCGASLAALLLSAVTGPAPGPPTEGGLIFHSTDPTTIYAGAFLFGAFAMPLYSLAAAHANDFAKPGQYAALSAGLLFTFAVGSMIGPLIAAYAVETFGPRALFTYTGIVHAGLIAWTMIRRRMRPTVPKADRVKHVPDIKTMPTPSRAGMPPGEDGGDAAPDAGLVPGKA